MKKMLYLSEKDQIQNNLLTMDIALNSIRKMYRLLYSGEYVMSGKNGNSHGVRMKVPYTDGDNIFIAMPAYLGGEYDSSGVKFHGPNRKIDAAENDTNHMLIMYEGKTGIPKAMMAGNMLTLYRTVAVSAYATEILLKNAPKVIGIIGPGKINTEYVKWLIENYQSITTIKVKGHSEKGINRFEKIINSKYGDRISIVRCNNCEDAVKESDIISIVTGFEFENVSDMPFIREKWIKQSALIICPSFIKFSDSFLINRANLVTDNYKMYESYNDELESPIYYSLSNLGNRIIDLVEEKKLTRDMVYDLADIAFGNIDINSQNPTLFSSGGMGIEDIALGSEIYNKALELKVGNFLDY